ncbi:MAG TPA: hypothetical protein VKR22_04670 [Acidimicrobiales bacterium]|nr:hypothetical protein [Acidimicrobiales bacterium]
MSAQRTTFGKLQRERDKQEKAKAKRERRLARDEEEAAEASAQPEGDVAETQATVLQMIAELHQRFDRAEISFDEFEKRNAELMRRLPID